MEQINLLKRQILLLQKEIAIIDNKSIYSFSYYFYNDGERREQLVNQINQLNLEIQYINDSEKRAKYKQMRDRDPLKKGRNRL
jgi:hypothetical protein